MDRAEESLSPRSDPVDLREARGLLEEWFSDRGVPFFIDSHKLRNRAGAIQDPAPKRTDRSDREPLVVRVLCALSGISTALLLYGSGVLGASPGVVVCVAAAGASGLLYLVLGGLIAGFRVHRIFKWGATSVAANGWTTLSGLVRGLPVLLVFSTFFVMTAELWQVLALIDTPTFVAISSGLVVLFSLFLLLAAHGEIAHQGGFKTWGDVRSTVSPDDQVVVGEIMEAHQLQGVLAVRELEDASVVTDEQRSLRWLRWVNAMLVVIVYESLLLVPLAAVSGFLFYYFSKLAVPARVAAEWTYGDKPTIDQVREIEARGLFAEPWFRVAVILTFFSLLYMAVTVIADPDKRKDFFSGADCELRQRLALELVYRHAVLPLTSNPPPDPAREEVVDVTSVGCHGDRTPIPAGRPGGVTRPWHLQARQRPSEPGQVEVGSSVPD
jgi:hypothetical protein